MMKRITVILVLLAIVILSACGQAGTTVDENQGNRSKAEGSSYGKVSVIQLKSMLENKDFLLINVHIPLAREIPGTDLAIPYNQIEANLSLLPEDRKAKIVLYCAMGPMSDIAAQTLVELGYTDVKTLNGGMMTWERQNFER